MTDPTPQVALTRQRSLHVMVGDTRSSANLVILQEKQWGRMVVEKRPKPFPFERWGFDNGAFPAFCAGLPFPEEAFLSRLEVARQANVDPWLAVVPDIVAGGMRSLEFSTAWRVRLREPWPWYLAVQDGMTFEAVEDVLHLFSGIFLGGTDRFKLTAYSWCQFAHRHHKRFHYGRAGTLRKLRHAYQIGADSLDSSFPLWSAERMRLFTLWFDGLGEQTNFTFAERCTPLHGVA
jgi:hypothetical protein